MPGAKPAWQKEQDTGLAAKVSDLLESVWPTAKNSSLLDTWKMRDQMMREIGPPMMVVTSETLDRLGRIPKSDENHAIPLAEAAELARSAGLRFFLEMVSHRWCSKNCPDDANDSKAKALVQWARYRAANGLCSFFWIDYSCVEQADVSPGVTMLPLYVASCNNVLCYEQLGYESRAWCRVERVLFASFCAPTQDIIGNGFRFDGDPKQAPVADTKLVLTSPNEGTLSYLGDMTLIEQLTSIASEHWSLCWKDGLLDLVTKNGIRGAGSLQFGVTQVRARFFTRLDKHGRRGSSLEASHARKWDASTSSMFGIEHSRP